MSLTTFVFIVLAAWRLSNLLANEEGPWHIFKKLRRSAAMLEKRTPFWKKFHLYEGCNCELCNSIWFGSLLTWLYLAIGDRIVLMVMPLAISTCVILIKYARQALEQHGKPPVWMGLDYGRDFGSKIDLEKETKEMFNEYQAAK